MTTAYIGIGSNEGDRIANLAAAVDALSEVTDTHVERASHAYESEPAYVTDQPRFANAVVEITTDLEALQLLGYLHEIEDTLGRIRGEENGPRTIDLDILTFGDEESSSDELTIPHPLMTERSFVVVPLHEIAPHFRMPDGTRLHNDAATEGAVVADLGPIPDLGVMHNEPVLAPDWVEVSTCDAGQDVVTGWDAAISLQREVLEDAGIPYAFDPYEPDAAMDPFGMPVTCPLSTVRAPRSSSPRSWRQNRSSPRASKVTSPNSRLGLALYCLSSSEAPRGPGNRSGCDGGTVIGGTDERTGSTEPDSARDGIVTAHTQRGRATDRRSNRI
jgi:2-amino-4-hydroxy-6-hydroxymethyldihydropteridine diphosphokinase